MASMVLLWGREVSNLDDLLADLPETLSILEVSELLRMSREGVRKWTNRGTLPALHVDGRVIILKKDLRELLERSYRQGGPPAE